VAIGQKFPLSDYYRDQILDAETISRAGGWWTAVLLIRDPRTGRPFLSIYRWQLDGDTWKTRKSIALKRRKQVDAVLKVMTRLASRVGEEPNT